MAKGHDYKEELRSAGSRATPGRLALLRILERAHGPLTVRGVLERSRNGLLDQVTVYRALESLAGAGLLRQGMKEGVVQYEYAKRPHHHHLVCTDCGVAMRCGVC